MHDATRRIGEHVSTNTIRVGNKVYSAVYYKGKMIATYSKGNVDWVRTVLDGEKVAIPSCFATYYTSQSLLPHNGRRLIFSFSV